MRVTRVQSQVLYNYNVRDICCSEFRQKRHCFFICEKGLYVRIKAGCGKEDVWYIKYCPFCGKEVTLEWQDYEEQQI